MALLSNPYIGDDDALDYHDPAAQDAAEAPDAWERLRLLGRRAAREVETSGDRSASCLALSGAPTVDVPAGVPGPGEYAVSVAHPGQSARTDDPLAADLLVVLREANARLWEQLQAEKAAAEVGRFAW